jgi:hypothetical protein
VLERENPYSCTDFLGTELEVDFGTILVLRRIFLLDGNCVIDAYMYFPKAK